MTAATTYFGRETSCTTELRTGRFVTGPRLVAEACYRRLTTPRGMLRGGEEEASYGINLMDLVGSTQSKAEAAALPGRIRTELEKDERIESVTVSILETRSASGDIALSISIEAVTGVGPFTLTLLASDVTVELLGIAA
jgi:hypothetical protein